MTRPGCVSNVNSPRWSSDVLCSVSQDQERQDVQTCCSYSSVNYGKEVIFSVYYWTVHFYSTCCSFIVILIDNSVEGQHWHIYSTVMSINAHHVHM